MSGGNKINNNFENNANNKNNKHNISDRELIHNSQYLFKDLDF